MTKILLVEDSKFLRLATERALARAGYAISSAADGAEALRWRERHTTDARMSVIRLFASLTARN